ncbi:hypothetical protein GUITHDRAFT_152877 [Guillardia theta CCMP2712]|uniref:Transmembrane protein n=1 Tax=Guillardia theta (strain CCMP2712) TaxID=905079 RepID=L1J8G8_GUITC|nr:hypothetical protein GUITHDRAFT_152877 [Guillardia theta CCMP2712]EKX44838.1 hypothetical protein GUITHDRAFT_152877 [Guillardia theta CCMP2712]|eukprot:XP_005831818.1 hypothetical protein GUITHDRAFT_152877 [Guillardia theta CCMP2712]
MLQMDQEPERFIRDLMPSAPGGSDGKKRRKQERSASPLVAKVLEASVKLFCFFVGWSWLSLDIVSHLLPNSFIMVYLPALCSGMMAVVPIVPSFIVFLPATMQIWLEGYPLLAMLHLILQVCVWFFAPAWMYKEMKAQDTSVPPYFTGLSVFAGIWVFGFSGIVYGPVLVNLVPVIYRTLKEQLRGDALEKLQRKASLIMS